MSAPPQEDEDVSGRGVSESEPLPCTRSECAVISVGCGIQVVDGVIRRSGCEDKYRAMENCLAFETNRDFRACAKVKRAQAWPQAMCT